METSTKRHHHSGKTMSKRYLSSKKSLYKTAFLVSVATVFIVFNVAFREQPRSARKTPGNVVFSAQRNVSRTADVARPAAAGRNLLGLEPDVLRWESFEEEEECRGVHDRSTIEEKCEFVRNLDDCANEEGFFDYTRFVYCDVGSEAGGMIILIIWWLFCFVGLAVCADDFFCPSLVVISTTLRLSNNVAGVTFLAFGNGAPDLFSAIAALGDIDNGDAGLAVGGLFGAGMFVTTMVVGTIAVIKPFKAMERPFLRDVCFYLAGVLWTFIILWKGYMTLGESIGYIFSYVAYVLVVVISGNIYKSQQEKNGGKAAKAQVDGEPAPDYDMDPEPPKLAKGDSEVAASTGGSGSFKTLNSDLAAIDAVLYDNKGFEMSEVTENGKSGGDMPKVESQLSIFNELGIDDQPSQYDNVSNGRKPSVASEAASLVEPVTPFREFLGALNPINMEEWGEMKIYEKGYEIFKAPIIFTINLTCPVVNYEDEDRNNWCRYLQCLQITVGPPICLLLIGVGTTQINDVFPVWALSLLIGAAVALLVFFTSNNYEKPKYHAVFGYAEFVIAIVWIYVIANEIVSLLETFGIVFNISDAILGLTLLAWGNSIGDWIANSLMARQGFARMGFAACFGAPFFNLMLGFGIPLLINMLQNGTTRVNMSMSGVQLILGSFLMFNMVAIMAILVLIKFEVRRPVGMYLLAYYIIFLVIAILCETGVLLEGWSPDASIKAGLSDFYDLTTSS